MREVWKPVLGREEEYEVSSLGRVRSLDRFYVHEQLSNHGRPIQVRRFYKGRMLRPGSSNGGHLSVVLGRDCTKSVHVLVLEAFVGPCPEGHECCHWDDNPANNKRSNLRWGTRTDNLIDAIRTGKKPVGEHHFDAKLRAKDIALIRERAKGQRGSIAALAREFSVNESTIRQVRDDRSWTHTS